MVSRDRPTRFNSPGDKLEHRPAAIVAGLFICVRPAWRSYQGVKVSYEPDRGNR
jgi:hypothetical protein